MRCVLPLLVVLSLAFAPVPPYRPKKEVLVLGTWVVAQNAGPGQPAVRVSFLPAGKVVIQDDTPRSRAEEGVYKADSKTNPPQIDLLTPARKARKQQPLLGVYKVDGELLILCFSEKERPKKVEEAQKGSNPMVLKLRRAK